MPVSADDIAEVLRPAFYSLLEHEIVQQETIATVDNVISQLKRSWKSSGRKLWRYEVGRGSPILFNTAEDKNNDRVLPVILVKNIEVDYAAAEFPFKSWDLALEIFYPDKRLPMEEAQDNTEDFFTAGMEPCARWHIDLANVNQPGPRVHLQYGGHFRAARSHDSPVKVPRWPHYPLDLILMSEVVAANFFTKRWQHLRENRNWCEAVHLAQSLCCKPFYSYILNKMEMRGTTILSETWNDRWID